MNKISIWLPILLLVSACNPTPSTPSPSALLGSDPTPAVQPDTSTPVNIDAPVVDSPSLVDIHFTSEMDGWGVTETRIVRTNDGGITWYDVTPPEVTEAGYGVDWFVLDSDHVWIQQQDFANFPNSGFQYRTTDGGINWSKFAVPYSGARFSFIDAENGWVLADLGVGAGSNAVAVYQTNDSGTTWSPRYTNDPNRPEAGKSLPLGGLKFGLTAIDSEHAWIHGVVYAPGTPYLFKTRDGGATWVQQSLPLPEGAKDAELSVEQIEFVSTTDAFLIMRITGDQVNTVVYVSSDSGNSWTFMPMQIPGGGVANFLSKRDVVLYNRDQFYLTQDAGQTWSTARPDIRFDDIFTVMDFLTPSFGYVLTVDSADHRSLYRTQDGGATWEAVVP